MRRARLVELAELVDIGDALDQRIATYSGGMKRRLDLAASLIHQPSVLFLDEPTTGLDPLSRQMVWEEVRRLNQQGVTIFLTTQYLEEADELADRVGIIAGRQGRRRGHPGGAEAGGGCRRHPGAGVRGRRRGAGRRCVTSPGSSEWRSGATRSSCP